MDDSECPVVEDNVEDVEFAKVVVVVVVVVVVAVVIVEPGVEEMEVVVEIMLTAEASELGIGEEKEGMPVLAYTSDTTSTAALAPFRIDCLTSSAIN